MKINSNGFNTLEYKDNNFLYVTNDSAKQSIIDISAAFTFSTTVPMCKLWASEINFITVNGRLRPFASLTQYINTKQERFFEWVLIHPIYSINESKKILRIPAKEYNSLIPPIPLECWKFYKAYGNKWRYDG